MEWTNKMTIEFLEALRLEPYLWDMRLKMHKNRDAHKLAWNRIIKSLSFPTTIHDLKSKKQTLTSYYRTHLNRDRHFLNSTPDKNKTYVTGWFAYDLMNSFLRPVYDSYTENPESTKELEDNSTSESSIDLFTNCSPSRHSDLASKPNVDTVPSLKRKPLNGPELMQPRAQTVEAFKLVKQSDQLRDDDECSTFGILIAQKLRKLTDSRRDFIMARINQVFYEENMERERQFSSQPSISSSIPRRAESSYMTMPTEVVSNDNSDYDQGFVLKEESCSSSDM